MAAASTDAPGAAQLLNPSMPAGAQAAGPPVPANQYVFEVAKDAAKDEIRQAVEGLFDVRVENVSVVNVKGKSKSFRMRPGRQKSWKKAYVRVQAGQTIEQLSAD